MASRDEAVIKQQPESSALRNKMPIHEQNMASLQIKNSTDSQIGFTNRLEDPSPASAWSDLPRDAQYTILSKLSIQDLFRAKLISKCFNDHIRAHEFHSFKGNMRPKELLLTALHFSAGKAGLWQCAGYDLMSHSWKKLPPFSMLPCLDPKLFKDHSICAAGGIMCVNLSTSTSKDKMIVFNPLTGRCKELPPLIHSRTPVLMQMIVDLTKESYKIIAVGSMRQNEEHLSKITEVYDSTTDKWVVAEDMPGPLFALNEHQTGVYRNGILYCIAFLESEFTERGVVAFNVEEGKWVRQLSCPLPCSTNLNIVQLVDRVGVGEDIVVFSEVETNQLTRSVEQRIDILEDVVVMETGEGRGRWRNVMLKPKAGSQAGLQVYPQYSCVPFGEGKVCVFDTLEHSGVVYDLESGQQGEALASPSFGKSDWEMDFYSMNPVTFSFEASFEGCEL